MGVGLMVISDVSQYTKTRDVYGMQYERSHAGCRIFTEVFPLRPLEKKTNVLVIQYG